MRQYELTYLISDDVSESELTKVTGKVGGLITELDGKIIKEESWGRRKLAYPINKTNFATYVTVYFEMDPLSILPFGKDLRHISNVVRQLIIVKDYKKEELTLTSDDIAESEDITAVTGSEKSVEAVTVEEIDNRDLMAKREKKENTESSDTPKKVAAKTVEEKPSEEKEEVVKPKAKTKAKKAEAKKTVEDVETKEEKKPAKKATPKKTTKKTVKKAAPKVTAKDEADRLSKLDDELDELLKNEI